MDCQINTQSAPDGTGIKIVTLVSDKYVNSLGATEFTRVTTALKFQAGYKLGARNNS